MNISVFRPASFAIIFLLLSGDIESASLPLFKEHKSLAKIPYLACAELPTALEPLKKLSDELCCTLFIKRDDCTGKLNEDGSRACGGNKVRKLEFLLADAIGQGAHHVLTFGGAGSNHALATAVYAQKQGLQATCFLSDQVNSWVVRRNLLLAYSSGAELVACASQDREKISQQFVERIAADSGKKPYLIPVGGSTPLGALGYVNAVFELQEQINAGHIPQPERIYLPAGSYGTTVGLLIGLQLCKIPSQVVAASVVLSPEDILPIIRRLFEETREYLMAFDPIFGSLAFDEHQIIPHYTCRGTGYGRATQATEEAKILFEKEGIILEDTYSSKAAAALIHDAKAGKLAHKVVLFWHTFYGEACTSSCSAVPSTDLPLPFHTYFQSDAH